MKKIFTLMLMVLGALTAHAGATFYANNVRVETYQGVGGTVYVENTQSGQTTQPATSVDVEAVTGVYQLFAGAIPADGWQFLGWSFAQAGEDGALAYTGSIDETDSYINIPEANGFEGEDSLKVVGMIPLEPNVRLYALFTHVKAISDEKTGFLGNVEVDKPMNDLGQNVTLTATADTETDPTAKFLYWVKQSTGEKITTNPLTLSVNGIETYVAHFDSENKIVLNFPAEGGYQFWTPSTIVANGQLPEEVSSIYFTLRDSINSATTNRETTLERGTTNYASYSGVPYLLYGQGDVTVYMSQDVAEPETFDFHYTPVSLQLSELSNLYAYYVVNLEKHQHELVYGVIPARSYYQAFPIENFVKAKPVEVMPWDEQSITSAIRNISTRQSLKSGAAYNLRGQRAAGKGIVIVDGKKVIR